jgi:hypothetical protein
MNGIATGLISITYTASPLTGCSYVSANDTTGVNSTKTISFLPTVTVIANSNLVVTLPPWFYDFSVNSAATEFGSAYFTCTGISVNDS